MSEFLQALTWFDKALIVLAFFAWALVLALGGRAK